MSPIVEVHQQQTKPELLVSASQLIHIRFLALPSRALRPYCGGRVPLAAYSSFYPFDRISAAADGRTSHVVDGATNGLPWDIQALLSRADTAPPKTTGKRTHDLTVDGAGAAVDGFFRDMKKRKYVSSYDTRESESLHVFRVYFGLRNGLTLGLGIFLFPRDTLFPLSLTPRRSYL